MNAPGAFRICTSILVSILLPLFGACSAPPSASNPQAGLDPSTTYAQTASSLRNSAELPHLGDTKRSSQYNLILDNNAKNCLYQLDTTAIVTDLQADQFSITTDNVATLNPGSDATCAQMPLGAPAAHQVKTWTREDFINQTLQNLQSAMTLQNYTVWYPTYTQPKISNSETEIYDGGDYRTSVQHIVIDMVDGAGNIHHLNRYFSMDSWFLNEVAEIWSLSNGPQSVLFRVNDFSNTHRW